MLAVVMTPIAGVMRTKAMEKRALEFAVDWDELQLINRYGSTDPEGGIELGPFDTTNTNGLVIRFKLAEE